MRNLDCLVVAVAHKQFKEMTVDGYSARLLLGPIIARFWCCQKHP